MGSGSPRMEGGEVLGVRVLAVARVQFLACVELRESRHALLVGLRFRVRVGIHAE